MAFQFPFFRAKQPILRLRHILIIGHRMELRAETFYRSFALRTKNTEAENVCRFLADDEERHAARIDALLDRWNDAPLSKSDEKAFASNNAYKKIFASNLPPQASWQDILHYALEQEKEMVAFYSLCDEQVMGEYDARHYNEKMEVYNLWKSEKLAGMIAEEEKHVRVITELLKGKKGKPAI